MDKDNITNNNNSNTNNNVNNNVNNNIDLVKHFKNETESDINLINTWANTSRIRFIHSNTKYDDDINNKYHHFFFMGNNNSKNVMKPLKQIVHESIRLNVYNDIVYDEQSLITIVKTCEFFRETDDLFADLFYSTIREIFNHYISKLITNISPFYYNGEAFSPVVSEILFLHQIKDNFNVMSLYKYFGFLELSLRYKFEIMKEYLLRDSRFAKIHTGLIYYYAVKHNLTYLANMCIQHSKKKTYQYDIKFFTVKGGGFTWRKLSNDLKLEIGEYVIDHGFNFVDPNEYTKELDTLHWRIKQGGGNILVEPIAAKRKESDYFHIDKKIYNHKKVDKVITPLDYNITIAVEDDIRIQALLLEQSSKNKNTNNNDLILNDVVIDSNKQKQKQPLNTSIHEDFDDELLNDNLEDEESFSSSSSDDDDNNK